MWHCTLIYVDIYTASWNAARIRGLREFAKVSGLLEIAFISLSLSQGVWKSCGLNE